jgi:hypothetical protein
LQKVKPVCKRCVVLGSGKFRAKGR